METHQFLSPKEVAQQFGVTYVTVCKWIKEGILKAIALPARGRSHYRIYKSSVEELWLKVQTNKESNHE